MEHSQPQSFKYERLHVYDVIQRLLHWWLAITVLALITTGLVASNIEPGADQARMWKSHMVCGEALALGFLARLIWGFIGPKHAQFRSMFFPRTWIESLKSKKMLSADSAYGHHPQASVSYIGFYALLIVMVGSGMMLAGMLHGEGPLGIKLLDELEHVEILRLIHEYTWWMIGFFIVTHIGAIIFHEWHDKIPLAQSMVSGFQYRTQKDKKDD